MYDPNDTIVAVSSPSGAAAVGRAIVRIAGPATLDTCQRIFEPASSSIIRRPSSLASRLMRGRVLIDDDLYVDTLLYVFFAPHSYTGDDVAEIHICAGAAVTEALLGNLLRAETPKVNLGAKRGIRLAGPGEFTARAYLAGKMDLAQAEAVNEVVVSSNTYQLAAAEKLLGGQLAATTAKVRSAIIDLLGLIEAGIDFSQQDIDFISRQEAAQRLAEIGSQLQQLLSGSINYESVIDLPAVGIAGAPNAGKSSLLNKLLGKARSIVSRQPKTTRDVLTGLLMLSHCQCVLFDCAGLTATAPSKDNILDELAQQAAIEALRNSSVVVFCVDISKANWAEDTSIRGLIEATRRAGFIPVATKCDRLPQKKLADCLVRLNELFAAEFLPVSAKTGAGLDLLRDTIDRRIIELETGGGQPRTRRDMPDTRPAVALTARHKQAVAEAIETVNESIDEWNAGQDEVTAMMLRAAYQRLGDIQQQPVDEQILQHIFSRFCIGK